jgi:hypothetical protein
MDAAPDTLRVLLLCKFLKSVGCVIETPTDFQDVHKQEPKSVSDPTTRCVRCSTRHILFRQNRHSRKKEEAGSPFVLLAIKDTLLALSGRAVMVPDSGFHQ